MYICFLTFVIKKFVDALQVVSEDGKKVRRQRILTESEMEELQVGLSTSLLVGSDFTVCYERWLADLFIMLFYSF